MHYPESKSNVWTVNVFKWLWAMRIPIPPPLFMVQGAGLEPARRVLGCQSPFSALSFSPKMVVF